MADAHGGGTATGVGRGHGLFRVEIVSPEGPLYRGEAGSVVAEAYDGEMGIEPGRAPVVTMLGTGVVRVRYEGLKKGGETFAVRGGFLQVDGMKVAMLVTEAVKGEDVDRAAVQRELDETLAALQHPKDDAEYHHLLDARRWHESRLKIATR